MASMLPTTGRLTRTPGFLLVPPPSVLRKQQIEMFLASVSDEDLKGSAVLRSLCLDMTQELNGLL